MLSKFAAYALVLLTSLVASSCDSSQALGESGWCTSPTSSLSLLQRSVRSLRKPALLSSDELTSLHQKRRTAARAFHEVSSRPHNMSAAERNSHKLHDKSRNIEDASTLKKDSAAKHGVFVTDAEKHRQSHSEQAVRHIADTSEANAHDVKEHKDALEDPASTSIDSSAEVNTKKSRSTEEKTPDADPGSTRKVNLDAKQKKGSGFGANHEPFAIGGGDSGSKHGKSEAGYQTDNDVETNGHQGRAVPSVFAKKSGDRLEGASRIGKSAGDAVKRALEENEESLADNDGAGVYDVAEGSDARIQDFTKATIAKKDLGEAADIADDTSAKNDSDEEAAEQDSLQDTSDDNALDEETSTEKVEDEDTEEEETYVENFAHEEGSEKGTSSAVENSADEETSDDETTDEETRDKKQVAEETSDEKASEDEKTTEETSDTTEKTSNEEAEKETSAEESSHQETTEKDATTQSSSDEGDSEEEVASELASDDTMATEEKTSAEDVSGERASDEESATKEVSDEEASDEDASEEGPATGEKESAQEASETDSTKAARAEDFPGDQGSQSSSDETAEGLASDGESVVDPPAATGAGDTSDPGTLGMDDSEIRADSLAPENVYHDGDAMTEDWGKEYGDAAKQFSDQVAKDAADAARAAEAAEAAKKQVGDSDSQADGETEYREGSTSSSSFLFGFFIMLGLIALIGCLHLHQ